MCIIQKDSGCWRHTHFSSTELQLKKAVARKFLVTSQVLLKYQKIDGGLRFSARAVHLRESHLMGALYRSRTTEGGHLIGRKVMGANRNANENQIGLV